MTEKQYIKWTAIKMKFKQKFFNRVPIIIIELDKKKFKKQKEGSSHLHAMLPKKASVDDRKKIMDNLNETIDLIRKYM